MRKSFIICLALVLTFFTMPFGGITAAADEKVYDDIADGEYKITAKALHADKDEASGAAGFINEEAILSIQDGEVELTITIPHNDMAEIKGLQIEGNEPIAKDEVDDQGIWTYKLDILKPELVSQVQYEVPQLNMKHDVPFRFLLEGLDELPVKEEEPGETESPKPEVIDIAEGDYTIEYEALHAEEDKASSMARYLENPASLSVENGKTLLTLTINDHKIVTGFQVEKDGTLIEPTEKKVDEEANAREITFELDELLSTVNAQVQYTAGSHKGDQPLRLAFNKDTLIKKAPEEEPGETEEPKPMPIEIADGDYTIKYEALHAEEDKSSGMARYLDNPASLSVKNGKTLLTLTINDHETVTGFQVEKAGTLIEPKDKKVDEEANTREVTYELDELLSTLKAQVQYTAGSHKGDQPLRLAFDKDSLVANDSGDIEDPDENEKPDETEEPDDTDDPSTPIEAPDNAEEIDYVVLHENGKDISTADQFFIKPGLLFEKDGKQFVEVTINSSNMIKDLSSFDTDAIIVKENDDGSIVVQFQVNDDLSDTLLKMRIVVPGLYDTEHTALFSFIDEDTSGDPGQSEEDPKDDPKEDPKEEPKEEPNEIPVESKLVPDKAFEIDYNIKQIDSDQDSVANNFFTGKAILLEKDGESFVQLTIKNGDMIKDLKNKYGEALLIKENNDGSIVVQLKVDNDLSDLKLEMHIVVPDGAIEGFPGYDEQHEAILVFDKGSKKEIDVGDYRLAGSDHPIIGEEEGPGSPEKPEFGDKGDTDTNGKDTDKPGKTDNPQTGDTTNIFLYAMLLIGSLTPLAVKLRRRFN